MIPARPAHSPPAPLHPALWRDDGAAVAVPDAMWPALLRVVSDPAWRAAALDELDGTSFALLGALEAARHGGRGEVAALAAPLERPDLADPRTRARCALALARQLVVAADAQLTALATWPRWAADHGVAAAELPLADALAALSTLGPAACLRPGPFAEGPP